jgi:hypothetical protein
MKTLGVSLLVVCGALLLAAGDTTPTALPPPVSLKEAVRVAERYLAQNEIEVSHYFLASVRAQSDAQGVLYWDAQWMHTGRYKGGWFIVRVQMDKTATLIRGK